MDDTLEARYSARPVSVRSSVMMRNPSSVFASTAAVSESNTPALAATRRARNDFPADRTCATRSPNPALVPSTTAMCRIPPPRERRTGTKISAAKNTGPRIADTQNHLVRTRSMNSRRITAQTLRTGASRCPLQLGHGRRRGRFRTHQIHKDLVQGRGCQLEAGEPRPGAHEGLEDVLGVGAGRQLELGILPEVLHLGHKPAVGEHLRRAAVIAVERDGDVPAAMRLLESRQGTVDQLPSLGDDADLIAQLLGV